MATVVDHLITKYTLDGNQYRAASGSIAKMTTGITGAFSRATGALGAVGSAFGTVAQLAGAASVAIGAAAYAGFGMMKQAAEFDTMASTFAGAFGSMEAGTNIMRALEERAKSSAYTLEALTAASTRLATSGLSLNRFVPMMEKFALVVSGTDPQGLEQVASAFARIKGGSFGEAMEVFRRAGIGADTLRAQGIKVDKGGQIQSSADELFQALERIAGPGSQIDNIAQSVAKSAGVTISNAGDAIGAAMRSIGSELNERFLPVIKNATEGLSQFVKNGGFEVAAQAIFGTMETSAGGFEMALRDLTAFLVSTKTYLEKAFTWGVTLEEAGYAAEGAAADYKIAYEKAKRKREREGDQTPELPGVASNVAPASSPPAGTGYMAAQTRYMAEVSANTKRMVNLQEMIVGGGGLAAMGIAANDLSLYRQSRNRPAGVDPMLQRLGLYVTTQTLATMGGVR